MNLLLFDRPYFDTYYNCSGRSHEEWEKLGNPNVTLGFVYATLGIVYLGLLLPFMVVFVKSDLMKYSCYKIMFFLGVVDCVAIPVGGFYCGYCAAVGMVFCMDPMFNYLFGVLGMGCWGGGSTFCMLLAINRCIDLINPQFGAALFSGKKTYFWIMIPIGASFAFMFFHTPVIFNSNLYAFFFDPFLGVPERHGGVDGEHYPHLVHSIHNIVVVIVLLVSYSILCFFMTIKSNTASTIRVTRMQRQIFIQSTLVCTGTFIAAVIYVYMQFFPPPVWVVVTAELCWQTSHGAAGVSYAFLNKTLRKEARKIYCSGGHQVQERVSTMTPATRTDNLSDFAF